MGGSKHLVATAIAVALATCGCRKQTVPPSESWQVSNEADPRASEDVSAERPPPDWTSSDSAIVHTPAERTETSTYPCAGIEDPPGSIPKQFGAIKINPFSRALALSEPDEQHPIDPLDYRVRVRFPDFSDEWHEFVVQSEFGACDLSGFQEGYQYGWHVEWGDAVVVVRPNLEWGQISIALYPGGCRDEPRDEEWYRNFAYAELSFMRADGSADIRYAEKGYLEPAVGGATSLLWFGTPVWGPAWCPTVPREGVDE